MKKITLIALTAALLGLFGVLSTPAYADRYDADGWQTHEKGQRPKPTPTPKPGPREGGADD